MPIKNFRHKGLKKFFTSPANDKDNSGVQAKQAFKIGLILDLLEAAIKPEDVNFPGSDFHRLKGDRKDVYSVHVNGNWTITFKFKNGDVYDVDLEDYH
jgi:proteic killer suppression protein